MDPASITGLISFSIESTKLIYKYVSSVKDASQTVSRLQRELESLRTVLDMLDSHLKTHNQALQETSALFKAANKCKSELKELQDALEGVSKGHFVKKMFHLLKWPLKEEDTVKIVEALHRYLTIFEFSLTVNGFSILSESVTKACKTLDGLEQSAVATGVRVDEIKEATLALSSHLRQIHHEEEYARFLDWLPALDHQAKHLDIASRRLEGSGRWLLDGQVFRSWSGKSAPNRTLFCHGGPGVGKTYLTSVFIHIHTVSFF